MSTVDLARLRRETAAEHAGTEETVPLMSETLSQAEYIDVLRRFYRIVSAWDRWAESHAAGDLTDLLRGRRRATLLAHDLRSLGETHLPTGDQIPLPRMEQTTVPGHPRAVFLGRMYVMEGSTLGGQYIARHIEQRFGLERGAGNAFFDGYGDQTAARWREFRTVLGALPETETETVIASAKNMFYLFAESMSKQAGQPAAQLETVSVDSRILAKTGTVAESVTG